MGRACSTHGERISACRILTEKPEGKIRLGRHKRRWKDNIKMELKELELCDVDWIHVDQDRDQWRALVNTVMNFRVP
jgi:hypothetical protein